MSVQFVDSYYSLALLNTKDQGHDAAMRRSQGRTLGLVTTTWVLVEVADALSAVESRTRAAQFIRGLLAAPYVEVIRPTHEDFETRIGPI